MAAAGIRLDAETLRRTWQALAQPWVRLRGWGPLAALMPQPPVLVLQAGGGAYVWDNGRRVPGAEAALRTARFVAVELPEDAFLRRRLRYPQLPDADLRSAIALEVRAASPFDAADLVWGFTTAPAPGGLLDVEVVSSSRRVVAAAVQAQSARLPAGAEPEVWAPSVHGGPAVLAGFGEARRQAQAGRGQWAILALVVSALVLATAIAVTPSIQLKLRGLQAVKIYLAAEREAAPLLRQREQLAALVDDTQTVRDLMGEHIDPLMLLDLLTQLVPDDTWVRQVQAAGTKVTIHGHTPDTAALMNVLSRHPDVKEVKSPQATQRGVGSAKESFVIEFQLQPHATHPFVAPVVTPPAVTVSGQPEAPAASPSAPPAAGGSASEPPAAGAKATP
jgi:general secretion pathway protein L